MPCLSMICWDPKLLCILQKYSQFVDTHKFTFINKSSHRIRLWELQLLDVTRNWTKIVDYLPCKIFSDNLYKLVTYYAYYTKQIGLKGEALSLHTVSGSSSVEWIQGASLAQKQPMTWYKVRIISISQSINFKYFPGIDPYLIYDICCLQTSFNAPEGNDPLALDMGAMGKGMVWINGQSIGRHWPGYIGRGNCGGCNYAGTYNEKKCRTYCGKPSQRW